MFLLGMAQFHIRQDAYTAYTQARCIGMSLGMSTCICSEETLP